MKVPNFIRRHINRGDSIPWWSRLIWPTLHFCFEWDGMLVDESMPEYDCCRCGKTKGKDFWKERALDAGRELSELSMIASNQEKALEELREQLTRANTRADRNAHGAMIAEAVLSAIPIANYEPIPGLVDQTKMCVLAWIEKAKRCLNAWRVASSADVLSHGDLIVAAVLVGGLGETRHWEYGLVRVDCSDSQTRFRETSGIEWKWQWEDVRFWMPITAPSTEMSHV